MKWLGQILHSVSHPPIKVKSNFSPFHFGSIHNLSTSPQLWHDIFYLNEWRDKFVDPDDLIWPHFYFFYFPDGAFMVDSTFATSNLSSLRPTTLDMWPSNVILKESLWYTNDIIISIYIIKFNNLNFLYLF